MLWTSRRHALARGVFRNLLAASEQGKELAPSLERRARTLISVAGACLAAGENMAQQEVEVCPG
jgi:hypothetical protein